MVKNINDEYKKISLLFANRLRLSQAISFLELINKKTIKKIVVKLIIPNDNIGIGTNGYKIKNKKTGTKTIKETFLKLKKFLKRLLRFKKITVFKVFWLCDFTFINKKTFVFP